MSEDKDQKQHEATAKKLEELRESGQTLRSKDLSGGLLLVAAIIFIISMAHIIKNRFEQNFTDSFMAIAHVVSNEEVITNILYNLSYVNFYLIIPIGIVMILSAISSVFILGGWNFSLNAISFKLGNLNPIKNLSQIFSKKIFIDVAKSFVKFFIIMGLFTFFASTHIKELFSLSQVGLIASISNFYLLVEKFITTIFLGVIVIVAMDSIINYFSFLSRNKMTTQELKDEHKNAEGNSEVKRKLRSLQISLARQKIPTMVPQATVVLTNPTHYAIALRYKEGVDQAPKVLAKGKGEVAVFIRRLAISNGIPVYEEPPLARAIYHTTRVGAMIHPALYLAVAIVISYIHQLRRYQLGIGPLPTKASNLDIPEQFNFKA